MKIFLSLFSIFAIFFAQSTLAATSNVEQSYIIKPYIINPSDSNISPTVIEKNKPNVINGLIEVQQFYASKLQGHTFSYSSEVKVINSDKKISQMGNSPDPSYFNLPTNGVIYIFFMMGQDFNPGGLPGRVWFPGEWLARLGSSDYWFQKNAVGFIMHELAHALGLEGTSGFSDRGHPCTIRSVQECKKTPGLGTTIPFPPEEEAKYSVVGEGADYLGDPNEAFKVGFNNTESSPEIQEFYKSPFINPKGDPAPALTPSKPGVFAIGEITDVVPYNAIVGDTVSIKGRGFGDSNGQIQFFYGGDNPVISIEDWKNSEIRFKIKDLKQNEKSVFSIAVRPKGTGYQIYVSEVLQISPKPIGTITSISPSPAISGDELVITGNGFGKIGGEVLFLYNSSPLISVSSDRTTKWTDSEIRFKVPKIPVNYPVNYDAKSWQVVIFAGFSGSQSIIKFPQEIVIKSSSSPASQARITQISPNTVTVGDELQITGNGFGDKTGGIQFTEAGTPSNFPFTIKYGITKWTDSEVKIVLLEELKKFPATISVLTSSGEKIISFQSLHPKTFLTPSLSQTPTPTPAPTVSASPIASTDIPCGNGGICRNGYCMDEDGTIIDSGGACPTAQSSQVPTPTPSPTTNTSCESIDEEGNCKNLTLTPTPTPVVVQKKQIAKITAVTDDGRVLQEIDPKVSRALSFRLPVEGINKIIVRIYYDDGSERQPQIPFIFSYKPNVSNPNPTQTSVPTQAQTATPPPSCGPTYNNDPCSESQLGQDKKNSCTTASGLAGQSVAVCKKVGAIYCWHDAYFDPGSPDPKSQFCYENKDASLSGLPANKPSCTNLSCLRGTLTQRSSDGSWYCFEGERWVGDAICQPNTANQTDLSKCDPQKVKCATGEIANKSFNGTWVCVNISTGEITSTVPVCQ